MYAIDPERLDLAREFRQKPFGVHSAELNAVLVRMRGLPMEGKHVLVMTRPQEEWVLAVMEGDPPLPRLLEGQAFTDPAAAEWVVFKARWRNLTGQPLELD